MSKKSVIIGTIIFTLSFISLPVFAMDYSSMETSELAALRGTMGNATTQEREAFRHEWQKRVSGMTADEASQYRNRAKRRNGDGKGLGKAYRHRGAKAGIGGQQNRTGACNPAGNNTNGGSNQRGNGNRR